MVVSDPLWFLSLCYYPLKFPTDYKLGCPFETPQDTYVWNDSLFSCPHKYTGVDSK